jgi:Opioid growth factor receptor (OGFr) conserved region
MPNEKLITFYGGKGTDDRGRRIDEIWLFSHEELESVHDYIQWLFPLAERSMFNPGAPLLDDETIARFRDDSTLRDNLERSLRVMLDFYGLAIAGHEILRVPTFGPRSRVWLTPHNHNFLRLTRILKSLSLLGLPDRAMQLLACLEEIVRLRAGIISDETLRYWRAASKADPSLRSG